MKERAVEELPLSRRTPELAAEVRRTLGRILVFGGAPVAVSLLVIDTAAKSSLAFQGARGPSPFVVFPHLFVPLVGMLLALAYLFDCWPAFLRERTVRERYGAAAEDLSGRAWRRAMCSGEFWIAFARGVVVAWAFASLLTLLSWWGSIASWSFDGMHGTMILCGGQIGARSWFMRRAAVLAVTHAGLREGAESVAPDRG